MKSKENVADLASCGKYDHIDWYKLTAADVTEYNDRGYTLLHYAAKHGRWLDIPFKLRDKKYWRESKNGDTIYISAYLGTHQNWIDKTELTTADILKQNDKGESVATLSAENRSFRYLPKKIITKEVLTQPIEPGSKDLVIHTLAANGQFECIPKRLITKELLLLQGSNNKTVFHIVAFDNDPKSIPKELWTRENLIVKDENGWTPLHNICTWDHNLIPKDITLEDLLLEADTNVTPLHKWASGPGWIDIPDEFLTKETLNLPNPGVSPPIYEIVEQYKMGWASRSPIIEVIMFNKIKKILSIVDTKTLKWLSKDKDPAITDLVKREMSKRKVVKELSKKEQSIEI